MLLSRKIARWRRRLRIYLWGSHIWGISTILTGIAIWLLPTHLRARHWDLARLWVSWLRICQSWTSSALEWRVGERCKVSILTLVWSHILIASWLARGWSRVRSRHVPNVLLSILTLEPTSSSTVLGRIPASACRRHCVVAHVTMLRLRRLTAKMTRLCTRRERTLWGTRRSHLLLCHVNELRYKRSATKTHICFSTTKVAKAEATAVTMQTRRRSAASTCRRLRNW